MALVSFKLFYVNVTFCYVSLFCLNYFLLVYSKYKKSDSIINTFTDLIKIVQMFALVQVTIGVFQN